MEVKKIVLTGGPRGGKTSIVNNIQEYFKGKNVSLITVPETASLMCVNGIPIQSRSEKIIKFQDMVYRMQTAKENVAEESVAFLPEDRDVYIIYDRGILDNRAYLRDEDFSKLLNKYNGNELEIASKYDYVIGLSSSSNIDGLYSTENGIRIEGSSEAKEIDNRTLDSWKLASNYRIISATKTFEEKQDIFKETLEEIMNDRFVKNNKRAIINGTIDDNLLSECQKVHRSIYVVDTENENRKVVFEEKQYDGVSTYSICIKDINDESEVISSFKNVSKDFFDSYLNNFQNVSESSFDEYVFTRDNLVWKILSLEDGNNIIDVETNSQMLDPNIEKVFPNVSYINNYDYYDMLIKKGKQLKLTK